MSIHNTHSVHNSLRDPVDEKGRGNDNRQSAELNAECRMQSAECRMQSAECRMQN